MKKIFALRKRSSLIHVVHFFIVHLVFLSQDSGTDPDVVRAKIDEFSESLDESRYLYPLIDGH
jgi:hypothetical protein